VLTSMNHICAASGNPPRESAATRLGITAIGDYSAWVPSSQPAPSEKEVSPDFQRQKNVRFQKGLPVGGVTGAKPRAAWVNHGGDLHPRTSSCP
jgi:hypothetical protein